MKHFQKGIAALCVLALVLQLFSVLPSASADTVQVYRPVTQIEIGHTYLIVADDAYALNNHSLGYSGLVTLGSTAVTVSDGMILASEVSDDMLWTVQEATGVQDSIDGRTQYFIYDQQGSQLNRKASSSGTAPLGIGAYDPAKPQYSTWSFAERGADGVWTMYVNSYRDSDYPFSMKGAQGGFLAPGKSRADWDKSYQTYQSAIRLYELGEMEIEPEPTDPEVPTDPTDPDPTVPTEPTEPDPTAPTDPTEPEPDNSIYDVVFLSDLHNGVGGYKGLIQMVSELKSEGASPNVFSHGGDYVEDDKGGSVDWQTKVYDVISGTESAAFPDAFQAYTMGNHDWEDGTFGGAADKEAAFKAMFGFDRCGVAYTDDEMEIYMIGAQNKTGSGGGGEGFKEEDIEAFDQYLTSKEGCTKVIFLQTHWPAHSSYNFKQRVVTNADLLIDTINNHAENMDIVWIWGHNHYEDTMRYKILVPGDRIMYSADTTGSTWNNPRNPKYKDINFIYANCGCMNDMWYLQDGHNDTTSPDFRGPSACLSVAVEQGTVTFNYNRIQQVNNVWTYSHDANITIHNQLFEHPANVVVDRKVPAHEHEFEVDYVVAPTCTEDGYTVEKCTFPRCTATRTVEPTDALGHSWDAGVVVAPTCTEDGYTLLTCTVCQATQEIDPVASPGHSWDEGVVVAPTCAAGGYTLQTCTVCGDTQQIYPTDALPHTWADTAVVKPTCAAGGYTLQTCAVCGQTQQIEPTDPLPHTWVDSTVVAPTCTEDGYTIQVCSFCGTVNQTAPTPAVGHAFDAGIVTTAASTASAGIRTCYCVRCDASKTEAIPRLPGVGPVDVDFTKPEDAVKYSVHGHSSADVLEDTGVVLVCTEDSPVGDPAAEKDLIKVPVSGDWTAVVKFRFYRSLGQEDGNSCFSFLAAEGEDCRNVVGIRGTSAALEDQVRVDGAAVESVSSAPGFRKNGTCWLRLQKEGDAYIGSWSADGETFTELYCLENTGVEAEYLIFDAYLTGASAENWKITLKSLNFLDVDVPGGPGWIKAEDIEIGQTYVIVADGAYAMTNVSVSGKETYGGTVKTCLGSAAVEIAGGRIQGEVANEMLWTFTAASGPNAYDGMQQYFLRDSSGRLLRRDSMSNKNAALTLSTGLTGTRRYFTWSFREFEGMEATYAMYANSERAYGYDYPGRVGGNEKGFDIPSPLNHRTADDPFNFMNDAACSKITLYVWTDALDLLPLMNAIHDAKALDPNAYTEDSAAALADAIAAAEQALAQLGTQAEADAAAAALNDAVNALELKSAFRFTDVRIRSLYYYDPVYWAYGADPQITNGISATRFGPDRDCTRAQVITFLWRAAGCPEPQSTETGFTDVNPNSFYCKAVAWAMEEGITYGAGGSGFGPELSCTRAQIVTFLWRYYGEPAPQSSSPFTDLYHGAYYEDAVAWAVENGITTGVSSTCFCPNDICTRGQVVTFLYRANSME